jgi:transposase InsO family protein
MIHLGKVENNMKGRYGGCHMTTYGHIIPGAQRINNWAKRTGNLSIKAKQRLKVIDWHKNNGGNLSHTSRHFFMGRSTLRRWLKRFREKGISGLEDLSRRPHSLRSPITPTETVIAVLKVRKENPTWSKYKIKAILKRNRTNISESSIARILKRNNMIKEKISKRRQKAALSPKHRYPRDMVIKRPGDLIQADTKHLRGIGGIKLYQFTAIDVLTKIRVLKSSSSISSKAAERFLKVCQKEFPFKIKSIQTDNGSEFNKCFNQRLKKMRIVHYFTETKSPKQNSYVERSIRTDKEEFYGQGNMRSSVKLLNPLVKKWQNYYNKVRPHQSLNYLTPHEYYQQFLNKKGRISTKEYIPLQT